MFGIFPYIVMLRFHLDLLICFHVYNVSDMSNQGTIQAADEAWGETCRGSSSTAEDRRTRQEPTPQ